MSEIKCIGILTSGGDAPGMNAAVWASVKMAHSFGMTIYGIEHAMYGEIVIFENGVRGMVQDIKRNGFLKMED